jgi:hypothetical protein
MRLQGESIRHAVAVAGMAIEPAPAGLKKSDVGHASAGLIAIYIHDDRNGPYMKAEIRKQNANLLLHLRLRGTRGQTWALTHILIPMHGKVRMSFPGLYQTGLEILPEVQASVEAVGIGQPYTTWSTRIIRAHTYIESLLQRPLDGLANTICRKVPLPRYVGVVSIAGASLEPFDVLLDTTSTERNLNCLGVVQLGKRKAPTTATCQHIAEKFGCPTF